MSAFDPFATFADLAGIHEWCIAHARHPRRECSMTDCPKCRGRMTQGYLFLPDTGGRVKWMDGEPGFWKSVLGALKSASADLVSRRCTECSFVEFYAETEKKPVKTLKSIDEENERL